MQIIDLEGVEHAPPASKVYLLGIPGVTESSTFSVGFGYVTAFDERRNAFVRKYKLKQREARVRDGGDYYLVDGKLYQYGYMIAPNKRIAIYALGDNYYSVYIDPETNVYHVISTKDLVNWNLTKISNEVPILLYRKNDDLFAIADDKVFRARDGSFVRDIPGPENDEADRAGLRGVHWQHYMNADDRSIFYSYTMDDVLAVHYRRTFERGQGEYFLTINLSDLSYKRTKSDNLIKIGKYFYKAVKRADGWSVYYIGDDPEDGVKVLDPLAEGGPAIVETLPGVDVQ